MNIFQYIGVNLARYRPPTSKGGIRSLSFIRVDRLLLLDNQWDLNPYNSEYESDAYTNLAIILQLTIMCDQQRIHIPFGYKIPYTTCPFTLRGYF
jgi:hypothetical protein